LDVNAMRVPSGACPVRMCASLVPPA
jgi:hypothetical protein